MKLITLTLRNFKKNASTPALSTPAFPAGNEIEELDFEPEVSANSNSENENKKEQQQDYQQQEITAGGAWF